MTHPGYDKRSDGEAFYNSSLKKRNQHRLAISGMNFFYFHFKAHIIHIGQGKRVQNKRKSNFIFVSKRILLRLVNGNYEAFTLKFIDLLGRAFFL
jgi:hypothetical protein